MKRKANNSHITLEGRKFIEDKLNECWSITDIANNLCRDKSAISREIERHITFVFPSTFNATHPCIKNTTCPTKDFDCYKNCKNIEINLCQRLIPSPHTCNGCIHKKGCRYAKKYYKAIEANNEYINSWKEDRIGLHYTEHELDILNNDFYNLVIVNKSIYHSLKVINNRGYTFFKESIIYRQIKNGRLRLKCSDLPRNRKEKTEQKEKEYKNKESIKNHTFEDYEIYKLNNKNATETQMDTVIGIINNNEPVILTLEIVDISFMFIFKLEKKTFDNTLKKLKEFKSNIILKLLIKYLKYY